MARKKNLSEDTMPTCDSCEWADLADPYASEVYCHKKKRYMPASHTCRAYVYDLLKRQPLRLSLSSHLEPGLLDD
jgi:hypothetical protein